MPSLLSSVTLFSWVCKQAIDLQGSIIRKQGIVQDIEGREAILRCAAVLARSGRISPATVACQCGTHLLWAARAGCTEALVAFLGTEASRPACLSAVLMQCDQAGRTPLSYTGRTFGSQEPATSDYQRQMIAESEACGNALVRTGLLPPLEVALCGYSLQQSTKA